MAADVLWLRLVQVLGKSRTAADDFEWVYHALDVITTLDPHYAYAYQVGGIVLTELAHRVDLSNRILLKGVAANPAAWWLPFNLGYNYYFYLGDTARAARYMAQAAALPGHPAHLPGLASRMYAEAGDADVALEFLEVMWRQSQDPATKEGLRTRMLELRIEQDLRRLERAVEDYREHHGRLPTQLQDAVAGGLPGIPPEPFGGEYRLDPRTGAVSSSTHPSRLRVHRAGRGPNP